MAERSRTPVDEATRAAEKHDAEMEADAGRGPTPDEEAAAERNRLDPDVAGENKQAVERGAGQKGEGRIP